MYELPTKNRLNRCKVRKYYLNDKEKTKKMFGQGQIL